MKKKFLIIRFSSIGDIVLTSPVFRIIKTQIKNAEVHFVTKINYSAIVKSNPYIDKVHEFAGNFSDLLDELAHEKFDYIIDLHNNIRSSRIKTRIKAQAFTFNKLNLKKYIYVNFKVNYLPQNHVVDRYLETLRAFEVTNDYKGLDFFIPENENFNFAELPKMFLEGYVAFSIAGTYFTKKLPVKKIAEICNSIAYPVILLGGETESDEGDQVVALSKGNVLNFAGKLSLNYSASIIQKANVVLTNDTGLMHIAAAFKKKMLTFWGNTTPQFGMYPYLSNGSSKIMEIANLKCRPCTKLGKHKCPRKHFKCMELIDPAEASKWIEENY